VLTIVLLLVLCAEVPLSIALAADVVPNQAGAFLAYCKTNSDGCADRILEVSFALQVSSPIDHKMCLPKGINVPNAVPPKVVEWLAAHSEAADKATNSGIQLALLQLYPCKR
jgi:hypothetical protein